MPAWPDIYVAAPWEDGPLVREVHTRLVHAHLRPVSAWSVSADGAPERLENVPQHERMAAIEGNDRAVSCCDAVLVMARAGVGGAMFGEVRLAQLLSKPVYWVGRYTLDAYRNGVKRCLDVNAAIAAMREDLG